MCVRGVFLMSQEIEHESGVNASIPLIGQTVAVGLTTKNESLFVKLERADKVQRLTISLPPALLNRPSNPEGFLPLFDSSRRLRRSLFKRSFRKDLRLFEHVGNDFFCFAKAAIDW